MFYAVEYAYGQTIRNGWPMSNKGGGNRVDIIHRFSGAAERDRWVDDGPDNISESGFRESLRASYVGVQRILREPDYFVVHVEADHTRATCPQAR